MKDDMENTVSESANNVEKTATKESKGSYGKRPLWQWILIYVAVGGVLYALIYYLAFARRGASANYGANKSGGTGQSQSTGTNSNTFPGY